MRVLGIDPGLLATGYGLIETKGERLQTLHFGVLPTPSPHPLRLKEVFEGIRELIEDWSPEYLVIEAVFLQRNVKFALSIGEVRGIIGLAAALSGIPIVEYSPRQIKRAVVGYGGASKEQVQFMVKNILGLKEIPQPDHAADALAVAICYTHSYSSQLKISEYKQNSEMSGDV